MRYKVVGIKKIKVDNVLLRIINESEYFIFDTIEEAESQLYELGFMNPPKYESDDFIIEQIL